MVSSLLLESYSERNLRHKFMAICIPTFLPMSAPPVPSVCYPKIVYSCLSPVFELQVQIWYDDACHLLLIQLGVHSHLQQKSWPG